MKLTTAPTPNLTKGFDCLAPVSTQMAQAAVQAGYQFAVRYVDNLTAAEIDGILGAGLALMLVKEGTGNGNYTPANGTSDGNQTVQLARNLGIPSGMAIFVDVEDTGTSNANVQQYLTNWYAAVNEAGYVPAIYVGTAQFTGQQLYDDFLFEHYWMAGEANLPFVYKRGYQMFQVGPGKIDGQQVDNDLAQTDLLGGRLLCLTND